MLFAYLIIAGPSEQSFSLPVHTLFGKQITDLTLVAKATRWRLSDKLYTAKQLIF